MKNRSIACLLAALMAAALVSACGGGGSDDAPPADDPLAAVPGSASQSPAGLVGYLGSLPPLDAESREPVPTNGFTPPAPDDSEPQDVGA